MAFLKHLLPAWKRNIEHSGSVNAAILKAFDIELTEAEKDAIEGKVVMSLEETTGEWLDHYGNLFGVVRKDGENDDEYRSRIIGYIQLERGTIPAIKDAIRNFLQDYSSYVDIYEPFNNVFILNKSKLNSKDSFLGEYYRTAIIDVTMTSGFPITLIGVINDFKVAGVKAYVTWKPKMYDPSAPTFKLTTTEDVVQKALDLQNNRDRVYLSIENSDIIGYKRVHKVMLARPLRSDEDINNPPYPVVTYGNEPWVLVPRDKAVEENTYWLYVSVRLEDEDFPNQGYSTVKLYTNLTPKEEVLDTLTPEDVESSGDLLLEDIRDFQERGESVKVLEQFMIEVTNS